MIPENWKLYNYIWLEKFEQNTWRLVNFLSVSWEKIKSNKVYFINEWFYIEN